MKGELLAALDEHIGKEGYSNRSEALRDIVRSHLIEHQWESGEGEVFGSLTITYDHHVPGVMEQLTDIQHYFGRNVLFTTHVHIDEVNCLEVIVLRGQPADVQALANQILALRGITSGKLAVTALICKSPSHRGAHPREHPHNHDHPHSTGPQKES